MGAGFYSRAVAMSGQQMAGRGRGGTCRVDRASRLGFSGCRASAGGFGASNFERRSIKRRGRAMVSMARELRQ